MENYNRVEKNKWGIHYYLNNKLHRLDGPAIDYFDGTKFWYKPKTWNIRYSNRM